MIHLGGDEVDTTCWTKSPSIMAWLKAKNLTTDGGYGFFVNKTAHLAASQGPCKVQSANTVHPFFLNLYSLAQIQCRLFFFSFSFPLFRTHTHTRSLPHFLVAACAVRYLVRCAMLGPLKCPVLMMVYMQRSASGAMERSLGPFWHGLAKGSSRPRLERSGCCSAGHRCWLCHPQFARVVRFRDYHRLLHKIQRGAKVNKSS